MIVPQLTRCRQCKTFLHGTAVEGLFVEHLLPAAMQRSPATASLVVVICAFYALMIVAGDSHALLGFSSYTLRQMGATHGPSILLGEWWRVVTSFFGHHDLLHLGLNLASLVAVGEVVERLFDRKKMLLIYLAAGVTSMTISHLWYVYVLDQVTVVSAGASGAVSGMIGAAWLGAKKSGPGEKDVAQRMKTWALLMVVWGLAMPGINNAAHLGGFITGALLARLTPAGITETVAAQRILSLVTIGAAALTLVCMGLMLRNLRAFPTSLAGDLEPRGIFGNVYYDGRPWVESDQRAILDRCLGAAEREVVTDVELRSCELNLRVNDDRLESYFVLARMLRGRGDHERAARLEHVAARLGRAG